MKNRKHQFIKYILFVRVNFRIIKVKNNFITFELAILIQLHLT